MSRTRQAASAGHQYPSSYGKNALINGAFEIWQRGATISGFTGGQAYHSDRWVAAGAGAVVFDMSRDTEIPTVAQAGILAPYSMKLDVTTADASIAAGDYTFVGQIIEGYVWRNFAQRNLTLSFWVKATKTGTYCVALGSGGSDRSYVVEYTISASETWEKKTINFPASPSGGTWSFTTSAGAVLYFTVAAGSTYQTTANAWQTGDYKATSNQVNGVDSTSNNFRLALVQLEVGDVATDFEVVPHPVNLMLCRRYYQIVHYYLDAVLAAGGQQVGGTVTWTPSMRTTPTVTMTVAGDSNAASYNATGGGNDEYGVGVQLTCTAAARAYSIGTLAASAEL